MYNHIILFKFNDDIDDDGCRTLLQGIRDLHNLIPEIRESHIGINDDENPHNKDYHYALIMRFDNRRDRYAYQANPHHQHYIQHHLDQYIADAIVFDMICD